MPHLENTEKILVQCNIVNNDYQHDSSVWYTFVPNKSFGQISDIPYIEVWFTDQNSKPLETEDEITITLVIN